MGIKSELDKVQREMERAANENTQPFGNRKVTVPPHLEGMVDTGAAQRGREKAAETDRNLSSLPQPRK